MVTEALGPSLYSAVIKQNKKLALKHLQHITKQILIALKFLKERGIIHCDLKPENILYKNSTLSDVKIIDFGSSVFINDVSYSYLQTRPYRAPELIFGCPFDFAVDMWSLGCVLYELVTSTTLFNYKTLEENIAKMFAVCKNTPINLYESGKAYNNFVQENLLTRNCKATGYELEVLMPKSDYSIDSVLAKHGASSELIDFIKKCLVLDRNKRMSVEDALAHDFIKFSV